MEINMNKIYIVGMGPGFESMMTKQAIDALEASDVIVGYTVYIKLLGEKFQTKELLTKVNAAVASASGSIVYLDKSQKHMYELSNKIRLINVTDYPIDNCDEFLGFICGIVSQDHDLEEMYLDSFLTIASVETDDEICHAIQKLDIISEKYNVKFVLSISRNEASLPDCAKAKIVISL